MGARVEAAGRIDGAPVARGVLESAAARIEVIGWGASLRRWRVALPGGEREVALGLARLEDYPRHGASLGAVVGRVANRIRAARFRLGGREVRVPANLGEDCLHGGAEGLGRRIWAMDADDAGSALRLTYRSPDGEAGFPGAVAFEVVMRLRGASLRWEFRAVPDRETPINLAQHVYWNLDGGGSVADHRLRLASRAVTPLDARLLPTGELRETAGGPLDFSVPRRLRGEDGAPLPLDLNFALDPGRGAASAAEVLSGDGAARLRLSTDRPGLQVFDMPGMAVGFPGLGGADYGPFSGLCLEAQDFPDAVNRPEFPSILRSPDRPYAAFTEVEIGTT
ncbi:MAG: aldose epimerase family protein [Pseudomonadota bacterium]